MKLSHIAIVVLAASAAGYAGWQGELHRRQSGATQVMNEVRAVCPANLVRFPQSGNLMLETGIAWDEQPEAWRRAILGRLQAAYSADHIWQVCGAQYRDEDGDLLPADEAIRRAESRP